ncbi:MAG: hypothetical protein IJ088_01540 [Clostridia bacterium]|nr:hypothetical protein [Clostridia bacterium]
MNTNLYDLGFALRESKVWEKIAEEEMFAVRLPGNEIGYCVVSGMQAQNKGLIVFTGTEGLSSLRKSHGEGEFCNGADPYALDCVLVTWKEDREKLAENEVKALRAYCREKSIPFRSPFLHFARKLMNCVSRFTEAEEDEKKLEAALTVTLKVVEQIGIQGKDALGLKPILLKMDEEIYGGFINGVSVIMSEEKVTIPLYTVEDGKLLQERIGLPPYVDLIKPPDHLDEGALKQLMSRKQEKMVECDMTCMDITLEGDPLFHPSAFVMTDEDGLAVVFQTYDTPVYDPNKVLDSIIHEMSEGGVYPKVLCVRNRETRILMEPLCRAAGIKLKVKNKLVYMDEVQKAIFEGYHDASPEDELKEVIQGLEALSDKEIRLLPNFAIKSLLEVKELLPADLVRKLKKALR